MTFEYVSGLKQGAGYIRLFRNRGNFAAGVRTMPIPPIIVDYARGQRSLPIPLEVGDYASGEHELASSAEVGDFARGQRLE
jgi:hypothetical protein